ncbi:MAG: GntR family transcriptional regulator [Desulfobacteraceae bacterium]|nr:MAG: GntR family transcriptional regulator [Desulfobacteraceae bacterium]
MEKNSEDFIYHKLKNAIIKGYIKQGTKLVETALAKQMEVSRTPIRGAIRRLTYEGFAIYEANKGACVIKPTLEEIQETFFVRQQLEKTAARLATENISPEQISKLETYCSEEIRTFEDRDLDEYYRINDAIHLLIAHASGNKVMARYIEELLNRTKIYLILYDPFQTMRFNPSIDEHQNLLDALKARDPAAAEKSMDIHLESAYKGMDIQVLPEDYISL